MAVNMVVTLRKLILFPVKIRLMPRREPLLPLKSVAWILSVNLSVYQFAILSAVELEIRYHFQPTHFINMPAVAVKAQMPEDKYGECLSPETLVQQVVKMREEYGFNSIKFKAGVLHPDEEIETIKQLYKELGPDIPLRIDPNSAWTVDTSVRVGIELAEELGRGGYLEDPTATIDGMAEVRRRLLAEGIDTPLASNVAVTCFGDIPESVAKDAVQIILCDHHYWGGMRQVQSLA